MTHDMYFSLHVTSNNNKEKAGEGLHLNISGGLVLVAVQQRPYCACARDQGNSNLCQAVAVSMCRTFI